MRGRGGPIYKGVSHSMKLRASAPCCVTCGSLICHVALLANLPRFACLYSFFTQFSRQLLRTLWCPKWVMCGTVGKLEKSTFQRYQICANQSSDGKVMAPRSQGVRVVFLYFSGKDTCQTGDVIGEARVACRSRSCSLS